MSKIRYEIFGQDAEITEFLKEDSDILEVTFNRNFEGLLSVDGVVSRVIDGKCNFDIRLIDNGKHQPVLVIKNGIIKLPEIMKSSKRVTLAECSDEYTRAISIRERRLCLRVEALEKELAGILTKLNTTIIF